MITRYFSQNPWITGPLEFLAGFGQQRQRVHEIEAGLKAQQDRDLAQSLGSGILTAGQAIGTGLYRRGEAQQAAAAQAYRLQSLFDLENLRSGNQSLQTAQEAFLNAQIQNQGLLPRIKAPPEFVGPPAPLSQPEFAGPPAPEMFGATPSVGVGQLQSDAVPPPSIDPVYTQDYQKATRRLHELNLEKDKILASSRPLEEKAAALFTLVPEVLQQGQLQRRYARPAPPTTDAEVFASGAAIPIKGTNNVFLRDPETGGYKVSAGLHPTAPNEPRTATTYDGKSIAIVPKNPVQLDESTWYVEDEDGKPHFYGSGNQLDDFMKFYNSWKDDQGNLRALPEAWNQFKKLQQARETGTYPVEAAVEPPTGSGFFERAGNVLGRPNTLLAASPVGMAVKLLMDLRQGSGTENREQVNQKIQAIKRQYPDPLGSTPMPDEVLAEYERLKELHP